jgi:hypothetical protein
MNILKRIAVSIIQGLIGLALIVFFAMLVAEWAAGCGESYVDAKGKTHVGQCIFLDRGGK